MWHDAGLGVLVRLYLLAGLVSLAILGAVEACR